MQARATLMTAMIVALVTRAKMIGRKRMTRAKMIARERMIRLKWQRARLIKRGECQERNRLTKKFILIQVR